MKTDSNFRDNELYSVFSTPQKYKMNTNKDLRLRQDFHSSIILINQNSKNGNIHCNLILMTNWIVVRISISQLFSNKLNNFVPLVLHLASIFISLNVKLTIRYMDFLFITMLKALLFHTALQGEKPGEILMYNPQIIGS